MRKRIIALVTALVVALGLLLAPQAPVSANCVPPANPPTCSG